MVSVVRGVRVKGVVSVRKGVIVVNVVRVLYGECCVERVVKEGFQVKLVKMVRKCCIVMSDWNVLC